MRYVQTEERCACYSLDACFCSLGPVQFDVGDSCVVCYRVRGLTVLQAKGDNRLEEPARIVSPASSTARICRQQR